MGESIDISPEPIINVDKSQENIKKLKDLENKQRVEIQN
jgi:hypothetical protein